MNDKKNRTVILTEEILEMGKSQKGGWSEKQFNAIGLSWPPVKGWKTGLIGMDFSQEEIQDFLNLKDKHLSPRKHLNSPKKQKNPRPVLKAGDPFWVKLA